MANRPPPPPREFDWARMLRTLSFWALVIVGSIALVQFASTRRQEAAEISYSEFVEEFESGNVAAVEITERQRIRGTFRRAVTVGNREAERFVTFLLSHDGRRILRRQHFDALTQPTLVGDGAPSSIQALMTTGRSAALKPPPSTRP